jgi:hypothetical protein
MEYVIILNVIAIINTLDPLVQSDTLIIFNQNQMRLILISN